MAVINNDDDRLYRLVLYSCEFRRLRGNLIEVFRMIKGIDGIDNDFLWWQSPKQGA